MKMGEVEIVQKHILQDIYRIESGIILKVNKYERIGYWISDRNVKKTKMQGLKDGYFLAEDYTYDGKIYIAGTPIHEGYPVTNIPPHKYWVELKISGGAIIGSIASYDKIRNKIEQVLSLYRKGEGQ